MKKLILFLALLIPSTAFAGGGTACVTTSPTVDTGGAYATGETIGGELTFAGIFSGSTGSGYIVSVCVADKAAQAIDLDFVPFKSSLAATSTMTDQAAFDPADSDISKMLVPVNLGSASRFAFADNSVHCVGSLAIPITTTPAISVNAYGVLIARGAYIGASSSDLAVTVCVSRD